MSLPWCEVECSLSSSDPSRGGLLNSRWPETRWPVAFLHASTELKTIIIRMGCLPAWALPVPPQPEEKFQNGKGHQFNAKDRNISNSKVTFGVRHFQTHEKVDNGQEERQPTHPVMGPVPILPRLGILFWPPRYCQNLPATKNKWKNELQLRVLNSSMNVKK